MLRIRDVYPGSRILIFTHPGSRRGVENNTVCCQIFFCSHKFHKIVNYFIFEVLKKNIWPSFLRIIELFTRTFVINLSNIWVWDPKSGNRKKPIPDPGPGVEKVGTGSRIRNTEIYGKIIFKDVSLDPDLYSECGSGSSNSMKTNLYPTDPKPDQQPWFSQKLS